MSFWTHAEAKPDKPALIFEPSGQNVSFGELRGNASKLANYLRQAGLGRGDHIALLMENCPPFLEVVLGALQSGLYVTPINRFLSLEEVSYILNDAGAKALIVSPLLADVGAGAYLNAPLCSIALTAGPSVGPFLSYPEAISDLTAQADVHSAGEIMFYSSGTTGRPKGVKRPLPTVPFGIPSHPLLQSYGFDCDSVYLSPAPLYHTAPLQACLHALFHGGTVVVMEKFEAASALRLLEQYSVTHSQWVPTMFVRMLKLEDAERSSADLSNHRCAIHAAAPCPIDVKREMISWWGPILEEYYGATERIGNACISSADWLRHPGSVGRPLLGTVVHICSESGEDVPRRQVGLIYFEQNTNSFSYHNDPERTQSSRHPAHANWITVGDIGYLDEDGYLYLVDRQAFTIISGGVNIYPQAIEDALTMHPSVTDVAVIGVPNAEMGEEVKAIVELKRGATPSSDLERELVEFIRPKVAKYALPRSFEFVDLIPRLPTGKLNKRRLRDAYWHGRDTK